MTDEVTGPGGVHIPAVGTYRTADGVVTAHGTAVPVRVAVPRAVVEGGELRVHAHARHVDRLAFGTTGGRGMVGRYLDLGLDVVAVASRTHRATPDARTSRQASAVADATRHRALGRPMRGACRPTVEG